MAVGLVELSVGTVRVSVYSHDVQWVALRTAADAFVSSDDTRLSMSGGVSQALAKLAGRSMVREARKDTPVPVGYVVTTSAGKLAARYLFHAVTVDWGVFHSNYDYPGRVFPTERTIRQLATQIFVRCETLNIETLVMPALGTGAAGFTADQSAEFVTGALLDHLRNPTVLRHLVFTIPDRSVHRSFVEAMLQASQLTQSGPMRSRFGKFEETDGAIAGEGDWRPRLIVSPPDHRVQRILERARELSSGKKEFLDRECGDDSDLRGEVEVRLKLEAMGMVKGVGTLRERSELAAEVFAEVCNLDQDQRSVRLDERCADDVDLRAEVEALLFDDAEETSGTTLEPPAELPEVEETQLADRSDSRPLVAGRYVLLEEIGRGGMAVVYLAWDLVLRRVLALKLLRHDLCESNTARELIRREAAITMELTHESIVRVYHYEPPRDDDAPFLVMEYMSWPSGEKWIADAGRGGLPVNSVIEVGVKLCEGLRCAHDRNILHGDIKPSNVFVDPAAEQAKLADFGLARALARSGRALLLGRAGTPAYMAPEQHEPSSKLSLATDVYQLAATVWDFLLGRPPRADHSIPGALSSDRRDALRIVSEGLVADAEERPRDARAFGELLATI